MRQAALQNGDFLALTLAHEWHLPAGEFELENGTLVSVWDTGVIVFTPAYPGTRDIILSCGIHGNETAPVELLAQMVQGLLLDEWAVQQRVMFIFGNPAAMNVNVREIRDNLNRLFSGAHLGGRSRERDRAAKLEAYVDRFFREGGYRESGDATDGSEAVARERCHYDLHTALRASRHERFAIYPFRHGEPYSQAQLGFLAASDIRTVLLMHCPTTTFSYFTAREFDAHAFTIELGRACPFGQNDLTPLRPLQQTLMALLSDRQYVWPRWQSLEKANEASTECHLYQVRREIRRQSDDFRFLFLDDLPNFSAFRCGDVIAQDGQTTYCIEQEGETVVFPNLNVAIGQRACLTVVPVSSRDLMF